MGPMAQILDGPRKNRIAQPRGNSTIPSRARYYINSVSIAGVLIPHCCGAMCPHAIQRLRTLHVAGNRISWKHIWWAPFGLFLLVLFYFIVMLVGLAKRSILLLIFKKEIV